ncbi:glycosyltransferase family 4 protein [Empedobacter tilapiae]|uniref:glycosyltransferase family 4 protein n=1 Tax=Empedobacter tilapiae TaxID=2491114 RepID=UPI0028D5F804|nr:glycosyltransferase family 4 protein [Empedobacter tilapiae]
MIYKILVGNEHGGAATSSKAILDNFLQNENFKAVFLCQNRFSRLFNSKNVENINSFEPPIITSSNFFFKILQGIKFLFWIIYTTFLLCLFIRKNKVKTIHTTNNHALLICLLNKFIFKDLYIISHWRCVDLASSGQYKFLLKEINKIICISRAVKESLPYHMQSKSVVIYNGVDVNEIHKENLKNKAKLSVLLNLNESNILLGTIGSYTSIKCHELIIECFIENNVNDKIKVVLIGSCPNQESERYLKYLQQKVVQNNLEEQIYFLEDYKTYPPKHYISDLDLFIGATWNNGLGEGFGLIYVEAMSTEVPVLAINVGAAGEIIENNVNGFLIESNSSEELFNKIQEIDFSTINIVKKNAFNTALTKFDISRTMAEINKIYEECSINN